MTHPLAGKTAVEIAAMPGVKDIAPIMARGKFALALKAEAEGDAERAEQLLNEAVAAEQAPPPAKK